MAIINTIVIHCSDSPIGRGDNAETIHTWHLKKGWNGIGYHYVITEYGEIQPGRPEYWIGAHVSGHNENSLGICLIGNGFYTKYQISSLIDLVNTLLDEHKDALVYEHCYFNKDKTCPMFGEEYKKILRYFLAEKFIEANPVNSLSI